MVIYHKTNIYYPYAPGFMGQFYLNQTLDSSLCYIYTIVKREEYRELQILYLLKYDNAYPIYRNQLSKEEQQLITETFKTEIDSKIDCILQELN